MYVHVLLGKRFAPDRNITSAKFEEVNRKFSMVGFERSVHNLKKDWSNLNPLVQHQLEDFDHVSNYVIDNIRKVDLGKTNVC